MGEPARLFEVKKGPEQAKPTFGAVLAATAKTEEPKAKKGTAPTLTPDENVRGAVDLYVEAKADVKRAEAIMAEAGEIVTVYVRETQDRDGFAGKYSGSYNVRGNRETCKVVYADKFSLAAADEAQMREIMGPRFDEWVKSTFSVKLKAEVFDSPELQTELMELMGDKFNSFFDVAGRLEAVEGFNRAIYRLTPEKLADLRTFAKQNKPSIR